MPNRGLSLAQGAIVPWVRATGEGSAWYTALLEGVAAHYGFSLNVPVRDLPTEALDVILNGSRGREGHRPLPLEVGAATLVRRRLRGRHPEL